MNNLLFSIILIIYYTFTFTDNIRGSYYNDCENIAHGCGMYNAFKYTNSLEAFRNSYNKGYRIIEIDMCVTKDNHIVGCHDWNLFKIYTNHNGKDIINYEYIKKARILNNFHTIHDFMLYYLLKKYNDVYIITDKISRFELLKKYSRITKRLYVEVSTYKKYIAAKSVGLENVLINIVNPDHIKDILSFSEKYQHIFGIIIGPNIFYSMKSHLLKLFKRKIKIYVYDINNSTDINKAFCKYVNGFYID